VARIEDLETKGFVIVLKWDGERMAKRRTVVINKPGQDDFFRKDCDDIIKGLIEGLTWAEKLLSQNKVQTSCRCRSGDSPFNNRQMQPR
jgi:hypothetical protein